MRYENLRPDTPGNRRRRGAALGTDVDADELARASISAGKKGEGEFFREAPPGGWREDLTPRQVRIVEEITAPLLREYYSDG